MTKDELSKAKISEVLKYARSKRKDYSTSGFKNPEVQKKIQKIKKQNAKNKNR